MLVDTLILVAFALSDVFETRWHGSFRAMPYVSHCPIEFNLSGSASLIRGTMTNPVLYMMVSSPPANSVLMLAELLGITLDNKLVDFEAREHKSPQYLKMNPMGTIPVLKDGDFVVSESHAILKYLLSKRPSISSLYPEDLRTRTIVDQCMFFNTGVFFVKFDAAVLSILVDKKPPSPQQLEAIDTAYGVVEAYLEHRKYIAADHLTLADLSVGTTAVFTQLVHKLDEKRFPRTADWVDRLQKEPFFSKFSVPGLADFKLLLEL